MATRKATKAKRKPVRRTRAQNKTLDEMHMGPEPGVDYFEKNSLGSYFNWYNYMYDRKQVNQFIIS